MCVMALLSVMELKSQVTIGSGISPEGGALLELKEYNALSDNQTSTKGMLYPRVVLTDKNELYPMYSPTDPVYTNATSKAAIFRGHVGLTVYNTKEEGDFLEGLHVWTGSNWRRFNDLPVLQPVITSLMCSSITLNSNTYRQGEFFQTLVKVPYQGGNGAGYSGTDPEPTTPINGLQVERMQGTLSIGTGEIMYRVFGTPTVSSPTVTTIPISFLGHSCNIEVGSGMTSLQIKNLTNSVAVSVPLASAATNQLPFGDIVITEAGSYAFSFRLYGRMSSFPATGKNGRWPFYIYLQRNGTTKSHVIDAAEIDIVTLDQGHSYDDYSYSVTLGGSFDAGDRVYIGMNKPDTGPIWTLSWGSGVNSNPVRTSLVYWKL